MRRFIIHITIFSVVLLGTIGYIFSLANGYSDSFYLKVSCPKKTNLILGTSKAAQGIQPQILNKSLSKKFFNYAFALYASPYGETYLNSIKNKLDTTSRHNLFILTVDVWSISSTSEDPNDSENFREKESFLGKGLNVNASPNFKYLLNYFDNKYFYILQKDTTAFVHDDGWLEVSLNDDEAGVQRRTNFTLNSYRDKIEKYNYSDIRYLYLLKAIDFLNKYGEVYLVRLPVHPDLMTIENEVIPDFNNVLQTAIKKADGYFDLTPLNQDFEYTDGVHLNKACGEIVSSIIASKINTKDTKTVPENIFGEDR